MVRRWRRSGLELAARLVQRSVPRRTAAGAIPADRRCRGPHRHRRFRSIRACDRDGRVEQLDCWVGVDSRLCGGMSCRVPFLATRKHNRLPRRSTSDAGRHP